jgi:hypothetical protein
MDHNKHMIMGALGKALADKDRLDLREAILQYTGKAQVQHFFMVLSQSTVYGYPTNLTLVTHVLCRSDTVLATIAPSS